MNTYTVTIKLISGQSIEFNGVNGPDYKRENNILIVRDGKKTYIFNLNNVLYFSVFAES